MTAIDKYAVFGNPVKQSKSPQIHAAFAKQTNQTLSYRSYKVDIGKFEDAARSFFDNGGKGLNITVPFKIDAYNFADELSDRARLAGAVNTLALQEDGSIYGDNTDGAGLIRDICENLGWEVKDKRVLLLGAGGAIRGVLEPLLKLNPAHLLIANRTVKKAQTLARDYKKFGNVSACSFEGLNANKFDLIINGTSASLTGELPTLHADALTDEGCCYDMVYAAAPTPFMRWGAENAAWGVSDGLGMLVEQAAESFCIWRGERPQTASTINAIREELDAELEK